MGLSKNGKKKNAAALLPVNLADLALNKHRRRKTLKTGVIFTDILHSLVRHCFKVFSYA